MSRSEKIRRLFVISLLLIIIMTPMSAYATTTKDKLEQAEKDKAATQSELDKAKDNLDNLKTEQNSLKGELDSLQTELTSVSQKLSELEQQILEKQAEIELTQANLEVAKATEQWQYECMKERIQFMYERSDTAYLEMFFGAKSFSEMLCMTDYITKVQDYDRKMLEEYKASRIAVEEAEAMLVKENEELQGLKTQAEEQKGQVSGLVANTSNYIAVYADQISSEEQRALDYEAKILQQESDIATLKKKLEEERALTALAAQSAKRDISEVAFAEGDRYLLANIIYCEAGGEPYAGKLAVGSVVINRLLSSVFPDTVVGVIYQNRQFSPVASGRYALALAENKATASCYQAADEAMSGVTNVGGCLFFRTPVNGLVPTYVIGGHVFY